MMQRLSSSCLGVAVSFLPIFFALEVTAQSDEGICMRTPKVQEEILERIPNHDDCATVTAAQLLSVTVLDLEKMGITMLEDYDFDGLFNLKEMYLQQNGLTSLPMGLFDDLTGLEKLYLYWNSLSDLPEGLFDGLSNLKELFLNRNRFITLPAGRFSNLSSMIHLSLGGNDLTRLPAGLFEGLEKLETINLNSNNDLSDLPVGLFDGLSGLKRLDLYENSLATLPAGLFDGLSNLEELRLEGNSLSDLPLGLFDGLSNLERLRLGKNNLATLRLGLFDGLTDLELLHLSENGLTTLPEGLFEDLSSLTYLSLGVNNLTTLPVGLFDGLSELRTLWLNRNTLSILPEGLFGGLSNLEKLHLQFQKNRVLTTLPADLFSGLSSLKELALDRNALHSLPAGLLDGLFNLGIIHLDTNLLTTLPEDIFRDIEGLLNVYLSYNPIQCLPKKILDLEEAGTIRIQFFNGEISPCLHVTLALTPDTIEESGGSTTVTATLSGPSSEATTIEVSVVPDSPATHGDYDLSSTPTLTIAPGAMTSTEEVTITAVDNAVDGPDKTFQVRGRAENPLGITNPSPVELTITDDDEATAITLAVSPSEVNEDAGRTEVTVTATLDAARSTDTEVTVTVDGGTATLGIDFAPVASFRLIILANQTSGIGAFELSPVDDSRPESSETVRITASTPELGTATTLVTIRDNDEVITLSIRDQMVPENVGEARVLVDVTPAAPTDLSVDYRTVAGTATEGEDYASSPGTLPISAGSRTASIAVSIVDDSDVESGETFRVELFDPSQGAVLDRAVATVTIEDDDLPRLQVGDASASEGDVELTFVVTLDTPHPSQTVRVLYETGDGTALAGLDYMPRHNTLYFRDGAVRHEVSVPIIDDEDPEEEETFLLRLSAPEHAWLSDAVATGTIRDDDPLPLVNIEPSVTVLEDAGHVRFSVSLSRVFPDRDPVVAFIVTEETAEEPSDYAVITDSPLRFESGQSTRFIEVAIIDDKIFEGDETFRVQLTDVQYGLLEQSVGMGTIVDNEAPVTVSIEDVTVSESEQEAVFPVTLSGEAGMELEFSYAVEDETAEAGQDYASAAGTVTFASGELRQQIQISILDDQETEPTETFRVRLSGDNILDGEGRGTILDDDAPLTVGIGDGEASEGAGSLALRVWLNRASSRVVTVQFASSDSTATSSADYAASRGMIIFEPGSTEGQIRIQVVEDEEIEPAETFQVALSNARHATIARGTGTGTILDNDGITSVSVQGGTVSRRVATFEVRLSAASSLPVLVSYASEDGSAKAGQDYAPSAGQITFTPGEVSKAVEVKLLSNGPSWQAKTFSLVLLSAVNAELREVQAEAVVEEEIEENVLDAYVSRVVRTWASHVVEALSRRTEGLSPCRLPSLSWLRYGRWRPSVGELFGGCGAMVTQGGWSVWGQGAFTRLRGMDGALSLRSDVTTMLVGADHVWSRGWMAGVLAAHSLSSGAYAVPTQSGSASSRLTGVYPYVSYQTGAGMRAWLLVGLGRGEAEVDALESEVGAGLVALGASGTLVGGTTGRLGYEADVLMAAAEVEESGSRLWVRRMRTGVEGSLRWGPGLQPYVEAALRHDSGDAETGLGVELGGGLRWSTSRLRAELGGRTLVLHTAEGLREWGLMAGLKYGDPGEMGPTMQVRPIWGNVYGGDLWREAPLESMGQGIGDRRLEVELGYGTWLRESLGRSVAGMTLDPRGRTYRIAYNLRMTQGLHFSVATTARPPSYGVSAHMNLNW